MFFRQMRLANLGYDSVLWLWAVALAELSGLARENRIDWIERISEVNRSVRVGESRKAKLGEAITL